VRYPRLRNQHLVEELAGAPTQSAHSTGDAEGYPSRVLSSPDGQEANVADLTIEVSEGLCHPNQRRVVREEAPIHMRIIPRYLSGGEVGWRGSASESNAAGEDVAQAKVGSVIILPDPWVGVCKLKACHADGRKNVIEYSILEHIAQGVLQSAIRVLRSEHSTQQVGLAEDFGPPVPVQFKNSLGGYSKRESKSDDAAGRGADDQVELIGEPPLRESLELGKERSRKEAPYPTAIERKNPERMFWLYARIIH
jgi:hypothetical protein